jgi:DNA modification methylase
MLQTLPLSKTSALPTFDLDAFGDKNYLTHNIHPYPAKFVPQIPRLLLQSFCRTGATILDPFCGSGTAILEASLLGCNAVGIDLNPLAVLISRVKALRLDERGLHEARRLRNLIAVRYYDGSRNRSTYETPCFRNRDKWFSQEALHDLAFIRGNINEISDITMKDILSVCFSAIIVKISNQESDTRWKAIQKIYKTGDAIAIFTEKLGNLVNRLTLSSQHIPSHTSIRVIQGNSKDLSCLESQSIDFVVTSPPYMNSYDYYLYHKLRMFWLGIDHYPIQKAEIGSRNRHSDDKASVDEYASEISQTLSEVRRVIKPNSFAAYVIGDAILKGQLIKMDELYTAVARKGGFKFIDKFSFDQRRYTRAFTANLKSTDKESHIILFQAC